MRLYGPFPGDLKPGTNKTNWQMTAKEVSDALDVPYGRSPMLDYLEAERAAHAKRQERALNAPYGRSPAAYTAASAETLLQAMRNFNADPMMFDMGIVRQKMYDVMAIPDFILKDGTFSEYKTKESTMEAKTEKPVSAPVALLTTELDRVKTRVDYNKKYMMSYQKLTDDYAKAVKENSKTIRDLEAALKKIGGGK